MSTLKVSGAFQQEIANLYQSLYNVIPAVIFQTKSSTHSTLCLPYRNKISSNAEKWQASLLLANNMKFSKHSPVP